MAALQGSSRSGVLSKPWWVRSRSRTSHWRTPPGRLTAVHEQDGALVVEGLTRIDNLEELAGVRVPASRCAEVDSVGGLVMSELGRVPEVGDEVLLNGYRL